MMRSWKVKLWNFHEEDVFKLVNELWVLIFIVLFTCKVANDNRPGKSADEATDAKDRVHSLTSIAVTRVGEVMKLEEAEPNCCQELISPYLIWEIYDSFGDVFNGAVEKTLFLE